MNWFKRITTLDILNNQIASAEKSLLENQHTADHYAAMAEGSKRTLDRLKAHKVELTKGTSGVVPKTRVAKGSKVGVTGRLLDVPVIARRQDKTQGLRSAI